MNKLNTENLPERYRPMVEEITQSFIDAIQAGTEFFGEHVGLLFPDPNRPTGWNGELHVFDSGENDDAKEGFKGFLKKRILELSATAVLTIQEAWFTDSEMDDCSIRPRDNPQKKEALFVFLETSDGAIYCSRLEILKGKKKRRVFKDGGDFLFNVVSLRMRFFEKSPPSATAGLH